MSSEQAAHAAESDVEKKDHKKSASFHLLPNSETLHVVKDPLTLHGENADSEGEGAGGTGSNQKEKSASFHRLPNSETLHVVKDPLTRK